MRRKISTGKKVWYFVILPLFVLILVYIVCTRFLYVTSFKHTIPFSTKTYNIVYYHRAGVKERVELKDVYKNFENMRFKRVPTPEYNDEDGDGDFHSIYGYVFGTKNIEDEYVISVFEDKHMIIIMDSLLEKNLRMYKYKER